MPVAAADRRISDFYKYLCANRKRTVLSALIIYAVMFLMSALISLYPVVRDTGVILGVDGVGQYYPFLLDFRRNLLDFIESVKSGNPQFRMMNFGYFFGTDTIASTTLSFIPFLPYYLLVVLVPESAVAGFLSAGAVILSFISGLSFIYLCSYFKKDLLLSGFMASFYVFCGNFFFSGLFNPHFLYMYIAFPLMIVGIDRIITGKGWVLFTLSVAWLSVAGLQLLVYTLPFVIIFAAIRVYFLYKGHFFRNLGKYFLRGSLATLLALALSGAALLIFLSGFFSSVRSGREVPVDMWELMKPSVAYLTQTLGLSEANTPAGICAAIIPCFIYVLTSAQVKKEIRIYSFAMFLLIAFPVVRYGLNLFQYELCRWGFIPAMIICFCAVSYIPRITATDSVERWMFIFTLSVYVLLITTKAETAAIIFLLAMSVVNIVPVLRKGIIRIAEAAFSKLKTAVSGNSRILLVSGAAAFIALVIGIILIIAFRHYRIEPLLIIAAAVTVFAAILGSARRLRSLSLTAMVLVYMVSGLIHVNYDSPYKYAVKEHCDAAAAAKLEKEADTFGRTAPFYNECIITDTWSEVTDEQDDGSEENQPEDYPVNLNLRYGIAQPEIFASMINGDYMAFVDRCGQERNTIISTGQMYGFGAKEELYSLFGISRMYSDAAADSFYGITPIDSITADDGSVLHIYENSYALPAGVTYSNIVGRENFDSYNSAELPFAMMDGVYLEGFDADASETGQYSWECGYDIRQELRGETPLGISCYDNYVVPTDDLSGCFVYLSFEGVNCLSPKGAKGENVNFEIDGKLRTFNVHNANSTWEWTYYTDHYTFPMGYQADGIEEIIFISPFEFESMKIYAVPEEVYTGAYERCTAETLKNLSTSTNTLTGDITVSSKKVLCINLLYSDGWTAYVDGVEAPVYKANGLFLGIPLEEGSHSVRLVYRTPLLYEGMMLSLAAWLVLAGILLVCKKKSKIIQEN